MSHVGCKDETWSWGGSPESALERANKEEKPTLKGLKKHLKYFKHNQRAVQIVKEFISKNC